MTREFKLYHKRLHFKFKAGTSRGVYTTRDVYFIVLMEEDTVLGTGECAPLPGLSPEYRDSAAFEALLQESLARLNRDPHLNLSEFEHVSSLLFALESATLMERKQSPVLFDNPFTRGEEKLRINGLIWMGDYATMRKRILDKIAAGFKCLKLKIGAIDFAKEMELLKLIRSEFSRDTLTLRVDANGAFTPEEVRARLDTLATYSIHSIEQPLKAGQRQALKDLCKDSPVPIALDEELIGITGTKARQELLEEVRPAYIVLKPTLHGGLSGTLKWIEEARRLNIGFWITSALESSVGLNLLSQFTGELGLKSYQGLGTGQLYTDNLPCPALHLEGESLSFDRSALSIPDIRSYADAVS